MARRSGRLWRAGGRIATLRAGWGRGPWRLLAAVPALSSLLWACAGEDGSRGLISAGAEPVGWRERTSLLPGASEPETERALAEGWGVAESWDSGARHRWSLGPVAAVTFHLGAPRDLVLRAHVAPHRDPRVGVLLNGRPIGEWTLPEGFSRQSLQLPRRRLRIGENRLEFRVEQFPAPSPTGEGDTRRLALLWDRIEWEGAEDAAEVRMAPDGRAANIPKGAGLSWLLEAAEIYRFSATRAVAVDGRRADLALIWRCGDGREETARVAAAGGPVSERVRSPCPEEPVRFAVASLEREVRLLAPRPEGSFVEPAVRGATVGPQPRPVGRDVILYIVDTLRADRLGARRGGLPLTPQLDAFSAESWVFERALAQASWTRPAIASILTGLLPSQHGAVRDEDALSSEALLLPEILRARGYSTAAVVTNANPGFAIGFDQGYDRFAPLYLRTRFPTAAQAHAEALAWLDARPRHAPTFLMVHVIEPHAPYEPEESFRRRFAPQATDLALGREEALYAASVAQDPPAPAALAAVEALYDAEVATLDKEFGRFVEALRQRGTLDQTLFVLVADHGEQFWEHGEMLHGKGLNVEEAWVPLIVRFPGGSRRGASRDWAQHVDIVPTVLAALGIEAPAGARLAGADLFATGAPRADRPAFLELDFKGNRARAVVHHGQKVIRVEEGRWGKRWEFYDLEADPGEVRNLAPERRLGAELLDGAWMEALRGPRIAPGRIGAMSPEAEAQLRALGYMR